MKKIKNKIKLQVKAGQANPSPPIGPALGQHGVNIMEFCKKFNAETSHMEKGMPIPVIITIYIDKTFTFIRKTPTTSFLLKKITNIKTGSNEASKKSIGNIKISQIKEVANAKMQDLTARTLNAAIKTISGAAKSMGFNIIKD